MKIKSTEGVVLKRYFLGEQGLFATIFTKDFGRINAAGKTLLKQSKHSGVLDLLSYNEIFFIENKVEDLDSIIGIENKEKFFNVWNDFNKYSALSTVLEIINETVAIKQPTENLFEAFLNLLHILDSKQNVNPFWQVVLFKRFFLYTMGQAPVVNCCVKCQTTQMPVIFFSFMNYGFLCQKCLEFDKKAIKLSKDTAAYLGKLFDDNFDVAHLRLNDEKVFEIYMILSLYLEYIIGKPLKSLRYLSDVYDLKI